MNKEILKIDLLKFIYYNFFCRSIIRIGKAKLIPYRGSIISLSKESRVKLSAHLFLNNGRIKKSKQESFLVLNGKSVFVVKGNTFVRYGSTIQVNDNAYLESGGFTCNVGLNIQCNKQIVIGNDCMIGRNVIIYDSSYHPSGTSSDNLIVTEKPVSIGNHVWLGTYSKILYGSEVGDGSIVGIGTTVCGSINSTSLILPITNTPSMSGMIWARSLNKNDVLDALTYYERNNYEVIDNENDIEDLVLKISNFLSSKINGIDFLHEKKLIDNKIIDSLGVVSLVGLLCQQFNVDIPFYEINSRNFNDVYAMAKLIYNKSVNVEKSNKSIPQVNFETVSFSNKKVIQSNLANTNKTVVQRIFEFAEILPERLAIITEMENITYKGFADKIYRYNIFLHNIGIKAGDRVIVQADHTIDCVSLYYAVHLANGILVPVEKTAGIERIKTIENEVSASFVFSNLDISYNNWKTYKYLEDNSKEYCYTKLSDIVFPDINSPCEMVFTTGTTGKSKGVLITHKSISWYSYTVPKRIEMKEYNRMLITTPLNHAGGMRRTHMLLFNGCCVVYMDGMSDLCKYFECISKYNVTSLYLPPAAVRIILIQAGKELEKYRNQIDYVYSSSSALPEGDCKILRELLPDTRLYNAYEASETPGVSAYNYNVTGALKNCIGKANEGVEYGILIDSNEITKKADVEGQICVKSPMNMNCYFNEKELTDSVFINDWFVSNDLGKLDKDGNCYYLGRKGDVINIGGYKISPIEVEEKALSSELVNECILIEKKDGFGVGFLCLLIIPNENYEQSQLVNFLTNNLEAYKVPREIIRVSEVKKTFNGKIDRKFYRNNI